MSSIQLWGGVEYTCNRVGDRYVDQLARSGHADRVEDLDRFAACGFRALRYPVLWEQVAPDDPGERRWDWADRRLDRIRALGMRPIVGLLHHGSGPSYTSLVDPAFPTLFAEYARTVAERYPWVDEWTPINEPLTTARFSGLYGHWFPHGQTSALYLRALVNQLKATVLAMHAIRSVNPSARLVQTEDAGQSFGTAALRKQIGHESERKWLTWDLLAGRVGNRHRLIPFLRKHGVSEADLAFFRETPCPPDVLGLNYYLTSDRWLDDRLSRYPGDYHGGNGRIQYADLEAVRARPEGILGHEQHLVEAWKRYHIPVALTEVHLGCTREEQMRWLVEAWNGAAAAAARGAKVEAVTAWALLGSFDWDSLVTLDRGHYEPGVFDVRGPAPRATALTTLVSTLAAGEQPSHPVLSMPGWWRRTERLTFSEVGLSPLDSGDAAPLLIVGARGTLGSAFQRICADRGLPAYIVTRNEMDMSDPAKVDAVLRRVRPWAVVNAAGYVRVDAAEADRDGCWRDNVTGPVTLAAACRRRGVPLATFSSDLVFDGTGTRPYLESDPVAPLNVYGAAKAEAERRVLDLLPEALVIRSSAFFGPWDDHNFATMLLRDISVGVPFRAADDATVSPTYVPDLVHAVLDLLIDGEQGIWHLANVGEVSWLEFGRAVAERAGGDPSLVTPCCWRDVWQPAARPPYSALGSERGALLRPLDRAIDAYAAAIAIRLAAEATRCASS